MTALAILVCLYLFGIFALSVYAGRRVHNEEDYLVAGRRLPLWLAWGTLLATWFGAATMLGAAGAARHEGLRGTVLDPFASGGALIVAGLFFARPLWEMRLLTMGDFYARKFGPNAEIAASVLLIPGYFGWIAAQYVALAGLQETFFGIDRSTGILVAAGIILVYTMIGGMWSVTMTDTLQVFVVLATLLVLAVATFARLGHGSAVAGVVRIVTETDGEFLTPWPEAGTAAAIAWLATWGSGLFGNIPGQDLMQRVFASRDSKTAVRACLLAGVVYLVFGLLPVGMGLASRILLPEAVDGEILGVLARRFFAPWLMAVFLVSLVSILVSTCTSAVLSPAAILAHNLLGRLSALRSRRLVVDRLSVLLVTLCAVAMAFTGRTILDLLELSLSTVLVSLFVPLVLGLYGRPRGELPAILAMALGAAVWLGREVFEGLLLPMPDEVAAVGTAYAEYIRTAHPPEEAGRFASGLLYGFALLPSAVSGTAASLLGYLFGQEFAKRRGGESAQRKV